MDNGVDTVSPRAYWEAYAAVCQTIGKETYETEELFLTAVRDWSRVHQRYLNTLAKQNLENNSNN